MRNIILAVCIVGLFSTNGLAELPTRLSVDQKASEEITFHPISHATFVIETDELSIYVDPVGTAEAFEDFGAPDIILITDIHYDHLDMDLVKSLITDETTIVGPKEAIDQLKVGQILNNGETKTFKQIPIRAIPMYNLTPDRLKFHEKGRGNGYILSIADKNVYISGDTEDIPEMRELKNINYAFICMNLPYTMTIDQAASAVLDFQPEVVIPYHYRGTEGMSDIDRFKELVSEKTDIEVRLLNWY